MARDGGWSAVKILKHFLRLERSAQISCWRQLSPTNWTRSPGTLQKILELISCVPVQSAKKAEIHGQSMANTLKVKEVDCAVRIFRVFFFSVSSATQIQVFLNEISPGCAERQQNEIGSGELCLFTVGHFVRRSIPVGFSSARFAPVPLPPPDTHSYRLVKHFQLMPLRPYSIQVDSDNLNVLHRLGLELYSENICQNSGNQFKFEV
jgi:hypothetical protein